MTLRTILLAAASAAALLLPAAAQDDDGATGQADSAAAGQDGTTGQDAAAAELGDVGALYPAEGAGITYDYCAGCHSTMLVAQQGQTRKGWDELLKWMVEKQGMQPIPEEDREKVLDYLATHYNTDRPHFPD